jgi:hypothetical protein
MKRSKQNSKIRKKNYSSLDPLNLQRESFEARKTTARSRRYSEKYRALELFSIGTNGKLLECGNILLPTQISLPKTQRPKFKVLQYSWKLVLWWKQWERWVLFDSSSYETKMSRLLRKRFTEEHLVVFVKKIGYLYDPLTYVIKIIDLRTKESVLTNPVILATIFRRKRRVSTLFAELDVLSDETKSLLQAKDVFIRSRNLARLKREVEKLDAKANLCKSV